MSSLLLVLSYPPFDLGWLAWGALVPWCFLIGESTPRQAFRSGYLIGFLFFAATLWWLRFVTLPGCILLIAFLAFYFACWSWWANRLFISSGPRNLLACAAGWALLEYARSTILSGFGWNVLAHTQWHWISLIQSADVIGVYGVSFLIVLVNLSLYAALREKNWKRLRLPAAVLSIVLLYGFLVMPGNTASAAMWDFKVAVTQGNIPQYQKWDKDFQEMIWKRYTDLTQQAAQTKPDLIIWPETSVPNYLEDPDVYKRVGQIVASSGTRALIGAPIGENQTNHVFNSAVLLDSDGKFLDRYDKIHLVPFGEFVPFEPVLGWLRRFVLMGDFTAGEQPAVFWSSPEESKVAPFSVLICFEDLFPGLCRRFVRHGAAWLIVITNDAWFEKSAASLQHLQASVFRAVENRVWVARSANTGWSGFIDPTGRILLGSAQIPRFTHGVAAVSLSIAPRRSLYTRWGEWFLVLCVLLTLPFFPSRKSV